MNNLDILWAVSIVATLAAVVGIVLLRRKPKPKSKTKPSINAQEPAAADSLFSTFDDRPSEASALLDPIAEADVYLAYGNRQQAVILLRQAALENPGRADIVEKIREIREAMKAVSGE
jgi:Tfp pilus assembly protein FimV